MPIPKAPTPSLQDSQRPQIEDLVERNKRLTANITRLEEQLVQKDVHAQQLVKNAQEHLQKVNEEWRDGLDVVQTCHRLAELRAADELEKERMAILWEQNVTRREKVARLHRDYKLTLFQMTEADLVSRVDELEDDVSILTGRYAQLQTENRKLITKVDAQQQELVALKVCSDSSFKLNH
jgi:predicted RNase H-like nuclease (RuvC/YqgF family)